MADGGGGVTVKVVPAIAAIPAAEWDACAGDDNPFCRMLSSRRSRRRDRRRPRPAGCRSPGVADDGGRLLAAVPLYLKNHSYGEYVFDWGWASAYERAGKQLLPQAAMLGTVHAGDRAAPAAAAGCRAGGVRCARRCHGRAGTAPVSSVHVTFAPEAEWQRLGEAGLLQRVGQQFHWQNDGYRSFDDFLEALNSRKRKQIRRERRDAMADGIEIETLTGGDIRDEHWNAFYRFYRSTSDRKWGEAYLTRAFFDLLGQRMAERVALVMARKGSRYVAGALNLIGRDTLYGRNWGCLGDFPFLHFEACYYRAIDFAIERGLKRVEAGAQGQHKIQRGYLPTTTYSAHWIRDRGFARAVEDFLARERRALADEMEQLEQDLSPFKREAE